MFNTFNKPKYKVLPDIGHSYVMAENGGPMPTFYHPNSGLSCSNLFSESDIVYFLNIHRLIVWMLKMLHLLRLRTICLKNAKKL